MGAEQSSARNSGQASAASTPRKTCYYELLGLDRQATDDEIRKAYRRKALELHPDRNLNDSENATRKFAEVQTAYEILSDPQERAWYDSHREAILTGNDDASQGATEHYNIRLTSSDDIVNLIGRFSSSVPMTDEPRGFFGILNAFFDQLAMEEAAACDWDGLDPVQYPPFGSVKDDYDPVAKSFYNAWSGFSTKKQFSWRDKYRLSDAPDRRIRRLMEKENKKSREEGIRDFNDAVRSLVAFVKKRDPRYVPSTQSEAERQKVLRDLAAAQAARSRAANQEKLAEYVVPEWARARGDDDHNDEFSLSEEESEVEHIECVVCSKTFKSEKQFEAHEKSRKHTKAVQQLQRQMRRENANLDLARSSADQPEGAAPSHGTPDEEVTQPDLPSPTEDEHGRTSPPPAASMESSDGDDDSGSPEAFLGDEYASRPEVENRLSFGEGIETGQSAELAREPAAPDSLVSSVGDLSIGGQRGEKKIGKAKAKREMKAARAAAEAETAVHSCAVCKETFSSRSKLFSHIKDLGHAAPVPQKAKSGKKNKR